MSRFFVDQETDRINIGDDQWIEIKRKMSTGDWERLERELFYLDTNVPANRAARRKVAQGGQLTDDETTRKIGFRPSYVVLLEINIVAWSLDRPLNRENINLLDMVVTDLIADEINTRNPR